jgi:glycosyltransferase involved in cell wall biosynthesis
MPPERTLGKFRDPMPPLTAGVRVLHVLAPAREGGLERVVAMLSAGQGRDRAHVALVVSPEDAKDHPFVGSLEAAGVPVTTVVVGARAYLREYRTLSALIDQFRPGVVHTHGYRPDVIGGLAARACHVPAVSTVHGFTGGGRRNRFNETIQLFALRRADAIMAVSRPLVGRLARAGVPVEKVRWVPNGFAPPNQILTRAASRQALRIPDDALVAGWVGRLSREKGADVMLDALSQSDPSWRLSIVGEGAERDQLKEQAAALGIDDRVTWHGAVPNAGALMPAFDALVLSSRTEGTPIALLEAMHAGVPIVATQVGGVPDVVTSEHALLVPSEEPGAIAAALSQLRHDPQAATRRSELARVRVLHDFSAEAWIEAVEDVYRAICA